MGIGQLPAYHAIAHSGYVLRMGASSFARDPLFLEETHIALTGLTQGTETDLRIRSIHTKVLRDTYRRNRCHRSCAPRRNLIPTTVIRRT